MVSTNKSDVNYAFGGQGTLISNVPMLDTNTTQNIYIATHGFIYTDVIISQLGTGNAPAEEYAKTYVFGNGQRGYLPSFGELTTLYSYKHKWKRFCTRWVFLYEEIYPFKLAPSKELQLAQLFIDRMEIILDWVKWCE